MERKKNGERGEGSFSWPEWLTPQVRLAFFSALLFGMLSHGTGLWNKLSSHDDIFALFWEGSTISSGRWMLHVLGWLEKQVFGDGHFSLPVVNGLTALLWIGTAAGLLVHLLGIRKRWCCAGLGCVMAAFPTVAGLFGYMFTVHYYMLGMGMMVISACLICAGKHWGTKIAAVLLGGCSVGIYQAFVPMLLSILLLYDLMCLAEKEENAGAFLKRLPAQAACVLGIMVLYFAMNSFFLRKFGLEMNTYMGVDQMGTVPFGEYLARTASAYREFFCPVQYTSADMYPMRAHYTYLAMICLDLLLGLWQGIRLWRKNRAKALLFFLMLALFPLANNFIYVMAGRVHGLMTFSQVMQTALFVWLADRAAFQDTLRGKKTETILRRIGSGIAAALLGLTAVLYARFDNQCYLKATFQQQEAISFFTALTAQIKAVPGFRDDMPVAFLNGEKITDGTLYHMNELDFIHLDPYGGTLRDYLNSYAWGSFMERWCGFSPAYADPGDYQGLPEVQEMPHYPDDGSIRKLGDVILVNF